MFLQLLWMKRLCSSPVNTPSIFASDPISSHPLSDLANISFHLYPYSNCSTNSSKQTHTKPKQVFSCRSRFRMQCDHCSGSGLIPGPGTSTSHGCCKKRKPTQQTPKQTHRPQFSPQSTPSLPAPPFHCSALLLGKTSFKCCCSHCLLTSSHHLLIQIGISLLATPLRCFQSHLSSNTLLSESPTRTYDHL